MVRAPGYREWRPAAPLLRHVVCTWAGRLGPGGETYTDSVLPDGCIDVVWDGAWLFVAGPDTGPVPVARHPGSFYVGLRFRPGLAAGVLGVPASTLLDRRVDAADLLGGRADRLAATLHGAESLRAAAHALELELVGWLPDAAPPDRLVEAAVAALAAGAARPVSALADRLGVSERQLHRRCTAAVGYGPKTLHRVLRFRRFLALAGRSPGFGLARLAVEAGYADQAHLTRETQRLAGAPPTALLLAALLTTSSTVPAQRPIRSRRASRPNPMLGR